jgi:integrase
MTFGHFAAKWESEILVHYRTSTKKFYERTLKRWILPTFRDCRLTDINTPSVQTFLNTFTGYSKSVLKHVRATFSVLMATAVDWQYLSRNPVDAIKLPAGKSPRRAPVLTPEQLGLVSANLKEPYRTMVVSACTKGMRESEVLGLKWEDFDPVRQIIRVRRSLYQGKISAPKTEESEREIPFGQAVKEALTRLETSDRKAKDFLFVTVPGNLFCPQQVPKMVFRPLAAKLGVAPFTWRSFRRSAETGLHTHGVPLKVQQQILDTAVPL